MKSEDEVLNVVICRFPNHKYFINELFEESESFRDVCRDYLEVKKILDEMTSKSIVKETILVEYELLYQKLQEEILKKILIK